MIELTFLKELMLMLRLTKLMLRLANKKSAIFVTLSIF